MRACESDLGSEQEPASLQSTCEWVAWALLMEQLLPPLPLSNPALLAAQIQGGWRLAQELRTLVVGRNDQGGSAYRNSIAGAAPHPEAENNWREQGEHIATAPCYRIAAGIFAVPSRKNPERNFI